MAPSVKAFPLLIGLLFTNFTPTISAPLGATAIPHFAAEDTIVRDVCVIGGGSTGTYAAIQLRDMGKSVVVVESKDRLGGHTETYTDPATNATIDYGVVVWHNLTIVRNYFARMNVPLVKATFADSGSTVYADFLTGNLVANYTPPNPAQALAAYGAQLAKYPYLEAGFDLPYPVPADLLLPFGEFVTKYSLDAMVRTVFSFGQGLGNILDQPTLYVFKNFGLDILRNIQTGFLTTADNNNSELYERAEAELGPDALLSSHILVMDREAHSGVEIVVETPSGRRLIQANKIVFTIPPKLENLSGFDLSDNEILLFSQFNNSAYYTGLLRDSGIPDSLSVVNVCENTRDNLPVLPGLYDFRPTGVAGLQSVKYGSPYALSIQDVKNDIVATLNRLRRSGTVPTAGADLAQFAAFSSHTPFELTVSTEAIAAGVYKDLYALQGQRHTYYTGAAFHTHDSSLLWQFTEALLPEVAAN